MPSLLPIHGCMVQKNRKRAALSFIFCLSSFWAFANLASQSEIVLVFRPNAESFFDAHEGLVDGLEDRFTVKQMFIERDQTTVHEMTDEVLRRHPHLIVLMGVGSIGLYAKYQRAQPEGTVFPPSLILMSLYADRPIHVLKNVVGISYEIPGVNSLNHLRMLVETPIRKVGTLYSPELEDFFQTQRKLCTSEKIELIGLPIAAKKRIRVKDIKRALQTLVHTYKVDALWVFNDTNLLGKRKGQANARIIKRGWEPTLKKFNLPVLVSAKSLMDLGHLGVFPDHFGLGEQAANMIHKIRENNWLIEGKFLRYPISVTKTVNMLLVEPAEIKLNAEVLAEMDEILTYSGATHQ